jgi:hypothetical protein
MNTVWLILGVAVGVPSLVLDQANGQPTAVLDLPFGPITRLASPDGSLILYGVPSQKGVNEGPQLWLEDARTHRRQKLLDISDGVSAGWSSHGTEFYVQDHSSSSSTESYIYDARSLKRVDLRCPDQEIRFEHQPICLWACVLRHGTMGEPGYGDRPFLWPHRRTTSRLFRSPLPSETQWDNDKVGAACVPNGLEGL